MGIFVRCAVVGLGLFFLMPVHAVIAEQSHALLVSATHQMAPLAIPERRETVTIAAEDNWPPYSDTQGRGLSQQLVKAALALENYQLQVKVVPYARALHLTQTGQTDGLWNTTKQQSTEQLFLLHETPLFQASSSFYFHGSVKPYQSATEIPDGTVVGVIRGYEYGDVFDAQKHRFQLVEVSTHRQLIQLLNSEKIDMAIFFDKVIQWFLKRPQFQQVKLLKGAHNHTSDIYVAFYKTGPRSRKIAKALDQGLLKLKKNGDYDRYLKLYTDAF